MTQSAIPVAISGVSWNTVLLMLLNLIGGGIGVAWLKSRPAMGKLANDREANLLKERADEMESMRAELKELTLRFDHAATAHAKEREDDRAKLEAERAIHRHEMVNIKAAFNGLLMLLKRGVPVEEAVAEIEAMRIKHMELETAEKATLQAALVKRGIKV